MLCLGRLSLVPTCGSAFRRSARSRRPEYCPKWSQVNSDRFVVGGSRMAWRARSDSVLSTPLPPRDRSRSNNFGTTNPQLASGPVRASVRTSRDLMANRVPQIPVHPFEITEDYRRRSWALPLTEGCWSAPRQIQGSRAIPEAAVLTLTDRLLLLSCR